MFGKPEMLVSFYGEYKTGILAKKSRVSLYVYEKFIEGTAAEYFDEKFYEHDFQVEFDSMKEIKEIHIQGNKCLAIDYINGKTVVHEDRITTMVFPNISNFDEAMETLLSLWEKTEKKKG